MSEGGSESLPRATAGAVALLRVGGVIWLVSAFWQALGRDVEGWQELMLRLLLFLVLFGLGAALYFGAASGIRHRQLYSYLLALVLASGGAAVSTGNVEELPALVGHLALMACLLSRSTVDYVRTAGEPAPRHRGPLTRLDDAAFGRPGSAKDRARWRVRR